jgi:toxin ParE1/3/4
MKLQLLANATRDLRDIFEFIEQDSPETARDVARRLMKSMQLLAQNPSLGRPSKTKAIREWSVPDLPYVVPYRVKGDIVQIIRIYHTRRQRPEFWSKR